MVKISRHMKWLVAEIVIFILLIIFINHFLLTPGNRNNDTSETTNTVSLPPASGNSNPVTTTASIGQRMIVVTWKDTFNDEDGFRIERSTNNLIFNEIATVGPNTTCYTDTNTDEGIDYHYRVSPLKLKTANVIDSQSPNTPALAAPINLLGVTISSTDVSLKWDDNSDNEKGFEIERRDLNAIDYKLIATVKPNVTALINTGLSPSTGYYYRVRAFNNTAKSNYSNEVYVIMFAAIVSSPTADKTPTNEEATGTDKPAASVSDDAAKKGQPVIVSQDTSTWVFAAAGERHTAAIRASGALWVWGWHLLRTTYLPAQVGLNSDWAMVSCGAGHTIALKKNGTIWGWGENRLGQVGVPGKDELYTSTQVGTDTDWNYVACGGITTHAIKTDGTLWDWELAVNRARQKSSPSQIGNEKNWVKVSSGGGHHLATKKDGTLWAWGYNNRGQLGLDDLISRTIPAQVGKDNDWLQVACGNSHTIALKKNGTLWAWGNNESGQLGVSMSYTNQIIPLPVGNDSNWVFISAGVSHSAAIKTDGTLWVWGDNSHGQLGLGDTANRLKPTIVTAGYWTQVACGYDHTIAIKTDGTIWGWGNNNDHQVGLSDIYQKNMPVRIAAYK